MESRRREAILSPSRLDKEGREGRTLDEYDDDGATVRNAIFERDFGSTDSSRFRFEICSRGDDPRSSVGGERADLRVFGGDTTFAVIFKSRNLVSIDDSDSRMGDRIIGLLKNIRFGKGAEYKERHACRTIFE